MSWEYEVRGPKDADYQECSPVHPEELRWVWGEKEDDWEYGYRNGGYHYRRRPKEPEYEWRRHYNGGTCSDWGVKPPGLPPLIGKHPVEGNPNLFLALDVLWERRVKETEAMNIDLAHERGEER
jgi:hypothetical protein